MADATTLSAPPPVDSAAPMAIPPLGPGTRLGRYELLLEIGRGGMAEVWAARQRGELGFSRLVALKTIRSDMAHDASLRKMFLDEARLAARVHHVNVVEVLDLGEQG